VTGLSCHRRSREALASQELDTSVGVSGPHDFAVRIGALVSRAAASIASRPNVHDDREAPLLRAGMARAGSADLPDGESEIFFGRGLDDSPRRASSPSRRRRRQTARHYFNEKGRSNAAALSPGRVCRYCVQTFMLFMPVSASVFVLNVPLSTIVVVVVVGLVSTTVHLLVAASRTT
jgi:hypothetical protein